MMRRLLSFFHPKMPIYFVYMLQQVEYDPKLFLDWVCRFPDLTRVAKRQKLVTTTRAKALIVWGYYISIAYLAALLFIARYKPAIAPVYLLFLPFLVSGSLYMIVYAAWALIVQPKRMRLLAGSKKRFRSHKAIKIAIAGSYGKTTMKELLLAVLSAEKNVAATPGNKNVAVSHAKWVTELTGEEEILLIEYGEGAPGDIARFSKNVQPDIGVITGLAPNHLDQYKTLHAVKDDLLSLATFVDAERLFINVDDPGLVDTGELQHYSHKSVDGWKISNISVDYDGTRFFMKKGKDIMKLHSYLIGQHQVGPLAFACALGRQLGVSSKAIISAVAGTKPYQHRMQPRQLGGAWIIDDTYNGNIQGILAGLTLMGELKAKRKIYVTPGLVDQGQETERVHLKIGRAIADAAPDRVVLMQNSVTDMIKQGLSEHGYTGLVTIEENPIEFYTGLEHMVAAGDLVLMQNDWTDNYN